MKTAIVIVLVLVLSSLAGAGLFMLRKGDKPAERDARMARALAVRVGLSIALFLFVLLSWYMGWIKPTGLPTGQ
jgi:flagellar basal body-associated protein FliL